MPDHTTNSNLSLKRCPRCGEHKPATLDNFTRDKKTRDGLSCWCKLCMKQDRLKNRESNRKYAYAYRRAHLEAYRVRKYRYVAENKTKIRAQGRIYKAVKAGKLRPARELPCFVCGQNANAYHHVDYALPFEVFPVCHRCHVAWHRANAELR